jgi:hypothetical protein
MKSNEKVTKGKKKVRRDEVFIIEQGRYKRKNMKRSE